MNHLHNRYGAPGRIRTCDPRLRRPMLYPTELRAHILESTSYTYVLNTASLFCQLNNRRFLGLHLVRPPAPVAGRGHGSAPTAGRRRSWPPQPCRERMTNDTCHTRTQFEPTRQSMAPHVRRQAQRPNPQTQSNSSRGTVKFTISDDTTTDETSDACGPPLSSHDMWSRLAELLYS